MTEKSKRKTKSKTMPSTGSYRILAAILIVLFLLGIGLILYLQTIPDPLEVAFNKTATAINYLNITAMTQISASATAAAQNNGTEVASPTAGNCGFMNYSGVVESPIASREWREALSAANLEYVSADVIFDAFEAQNDCQGGLTPLPHQCLFMAINVDIDSWNDQAALFAQLEAIVASVEAANVCDEPAAELHVFFFTNISDYHMWSGGRTAILDSYRNGLRGEALWALGIVTEGR